MDLVQKARVRSDVEGDENTEFFRGILKQKRHQQMVQGIMINGEWVTIPLQVKMAFYKFYKEKFDASDSLMELSPFVPLATLNHDDKLELKKPSFRRRYSFGCLELWEPKISRPGCELMSSYKKKKKNLTLFKEDFEKAFDSVSWKFLDHMLLSLGFGNHWRRWIHVCLHSARASVLINGSPSSEFSLKRGLRQGDPLSPFLFIIIMERLHIAFKDVVYSGLISGAMIGDSGFKLSHLFYVDDVVIISDRNRQDVINIIRIIHVFFLASGLKINISKSKIYGLGVSTNDRENLAHDTGCDSDRFKAKLSSWKACTLSIEARLTLIKSVLGSLGIYYMSIFKCPESVLKTLEAIRASLFRGGSSEKKNMAWIKWENVLASFEKGGLNIRSLKSFNLTLLQKWRWRLVNNPDSLWARVIIAIHCVEAGLDLKGCNCNGVWSSIISSYSMLHDCNFLPLGNLCRKVGNGTSIRFWKDSWNGNGSLMTRFNRLYHLDSNKDCLLSDRNVNGSWVWSWKMQVVGSRNETTYPFIS
uniref:RNA-directed DNA polymerase, eukaryota, reverse transcriptase zinc-binding domain protein n=1 Tax=Tanacetum cinerariifolium TaxID=118510 RepID=A0A6L2KRJ6_TANCI|nr:RNA-directed DNA polymerase, eukaryota, reverse transcriptase zinc-binding domain protein [Tanacetum cinerariifolium]